jgi:hypothetical protein
MEATGATLEEERGTEGSMKAFSVQSRRVGAAQRSPSSNPADASAARLAFNDFNVQRFQRATLFYSKLL